MSSPPERWYGCSTGTLPHTIPGVVHAPSSLALPFAAVLVLSACHALPLTTPEPMLPTPVTTPGGTARPLPTATDQPTSTPARPSAPSESPALRPSTTPADSPSPAGSPSPTPPLSTPSGEGFWRFVEEGFPEREGPAISGVLATDSGYVAVGRDTYYVGVPWGDDWPANRETALIINGAVLTSPDAFSWTEQEVPEMEGAWMGGAVEHDGRLYASGMVGSCLPMLDCPPPPENAGTNFWRSGDGRQWELLPQPVEMKQDVVGLLSVGDRLWGPSSIRTEVFYTSTDGAVWAIGELPAPVTVPKAIGDETVVFFERTPLGDSATAWFTPDAGASWRSGPVDLPSGAVIWDVAAGDGLMVAVGGTAKFDEVQFPASWASTDGINWSGGLSREFPGNHFDFVIAVPNGFLAIEGERSATYDQGSETWFSSDGVRWQLIDVPAEQRPHSVHAVGSGPLGVVVFGGVGVEVPGKGMRTGQTVTEGRLRSWFAPASTLQDLGR